MNASVVVSYVVIAFVSFVASVIIVCGWLLYAQIRWTVSW